MSDVETLESYKERALRLIGSGAVRVYKTPMRNPKVKNDERDLATNIQRIRKQGSKTILVHGSGGMGSAWSYG